MTNIVPNENAPDEVVRYGLGETADFELGPGDTYETNDPAILAEAETHPWLAVERDEAEADEGVFVDRHVPREDDVLSAQNSKAFDPEAIAAARAAALGEQPQPAAVQAGLDQGERDDGAVADTLAEVAIRDEAAAENEDFNPEDDE